MQVEAAYVHSPSVDSKKELQFEFVPEGPVYNSSNTYAHTCIEDIQAQLLGR